MPDDLSVYFQFTTLDKIRAYGREHRAEFAEEFDPEKIGALWIKKGGMHICMVTHPPVEPETKFTSEWWDWIRERAQWFGLWMHELSHAQRGSHVHIKERHG